MPVDYKAEKRGFAAFTPLTKVTGFRAKDFNEKCSPFKEIINRIWKILMRGEI